MALLTSRPAPPESALAASEMAPLARRLLAVGDLEGYRRLFEHLAAIEDPHRRHWAGGRLLECGLRARPTCPPGLVPALLRILAAAAVEALEHEPSEPLLLQSAGVIFGELHSPTASEALFAAARRLDPELGQSDRDCASRVSRATSRRESADGWAPHAAVAELSRRAIALASRAGAAEGLTLSLCMIVRDEAEMLPRCLAAVAEAVAEIVIVDTGSRDATIEIARSFGARVIEHAWTGSFAEARNVSFDAARGDWLMYLDADEVLVPEDAGLLRSLTGRTWREAFYLSETNHTGELGDGAAVTHDALRVFRNRPEYRFEGRVHEQIAHRLPGYLPERLERTEVRVEHFGYLGDVRARREKSARNIELLRLQQAEGPPSAFLHFNLGSEHAAAGDLPAAVAQLERSWALLSPLDALDAHEFVPALISRLVAALRASGRPAEAFARAQEGLERLPGFTDLVFEQALASIALDQLELAGELLERCIEMGEAPRRYAPRVGCGTQLALLELAELRRAAGEADRAIELLEQCLREHPHHARARLMLADCLLEQRRYGEAADVAAGPVASASELIERLEASLRGQDFATFAALLAELEHTPLSARERREQLAELYFRCGYAASAAEEWMAVCEREPDVRALLGLARVAAARDMPREASEFTAAACALRGRVSSGDGG